MNTENSELPKVLIVDDVLENIQILHAILEDRYTTSFATSGPQALELVRKQNPDIVLLDVRMPEMSGYEVCRALKADPSSENTPVIFITSLDDTDDETLGFESGGVDYITKPVSGPIVRARVGTHVQLKRQADALRRLSAQDGLTGLANRRRFDEMLQANWSRCGRSGGPLSLVMVDVDFFKQYNDTYGHGPGDDCLRAVARVLSEQVKRLDDLAARYGGEEFALLLPHTDSEGAFEFALRLVKSVGDLGLPHRGSRAGGHVTISAGVATAVVGPGQTPAALVERADRALYLAKEAGRNRVKRWETAGV